MIAPHSLDAASRFFLRIGQAGRASKRYDEISLPLFPLALIMEAEGKLSAAARNLTQGVNDESRSVVRQP